MTRPRGSDGGCGSASASLAVALVAAVIPTALAAHDAADLMLDGRDAASRGLGRGTRRRHRSPPRGAFDEAARTFRRHARQARLAAAVGGPGGPRRRVEPRRGARARRRSAPTSPRRASVGHHRRRPRRPRGRRRSAADRGGGEGHARARRGARRAHRRAAPARRRARRPVPRRARSRTRVEKIHDQLVQAEREARARRRRRRFAPALFGGEGPRRYLLVVQNNAESRATGGFIGSFGIIDRQGRQAHGRASSSARRSGTAPSASATTCSWSAPDDYRARYTQFRPETTSRT